MSGMLYSLLTLFALARSQNYDCDCYPNTLCENTPWAVFKNGLYWAWASPCSGGCSQLPRPLPYGWRRATNAEWAGGYPSAADFGNGALCSAHIFDPRWDHCDLSNYEAGQVIHYEINYYWETLIVHDPCADESIVVPQDPLPCKAAQEYCKNTYGTNLATIKTDDDRAAAQTALNDGGEAFAFIGLYSDDVETKWQFRSGDTCPSASAYKCVDFWRTAPGGGNNRPRCIGDGEGGFGCAVIYADDGRVDNDKPSNLPFPFLCDLAESD